LPAVLGRAAGSAAAAARRFELVARRGSARHRRSPHLYRLDIRFRAGFERMVPERLMVMSTVKNFLTQQRPARTCGSCTLCCKLMGVVAIAKAVNSWCPHCQKGKGCRIYDSRPEECRAYACEWLTKPTWPEALKPDKCRVVFSMLDEGGPFLHVIADPGYPGALQDPLVREAIERARSRNLDVIAWVGERRTVYTGDEPSSDVGRKANKAAGREVSHP
jgi:hypothetical protein